MRPHHVCRPLRVAKPPREENRPSARKQLSELLPELVHDVPAQTRSQTSSPSGHPDIGKPVITLSVRIDAALQERLGTLDPRRVQPHAHGDVVEIPIVCEPRSSTRIEQVAHLLFLRAAIHLQQLPASTRYVSLATATAARCRYDVRLPVYGLQPSRRPRETWFGQQPWQRPYPVDFVIRPSPPVEVANDPDHDHPAARFIDLNLPALDAAWTYDQGRLIVAFEPRDDSDEDLVLFGIQADTAPQLSHRKHDRGASYGSLFLQEQESRVMHIEYAPRALRGQETDPDEWLSSDPDIEVHIRRWALRFEGDIAEIVLERSGEIR
jgi:hypothetical protein